MGKRLPPGEVMEVCTCGVSIPIQERTCRGCGKIQHRGTLSRLDRLTTPELALLAARLSARHDELWAECKENHARLDALTARLQAAERLLRARQQDEERGQGVLRLEVAA